MRRYWKSTKIWPLLEMAFSESLGYIRDDISRMMRALGRRLGLKTDTDNRKGLREGESLSGASREGSKVTKGRQLARIEGGASNPTVFLSACVNKDWNGGGKYCGGTKELNLMAQMLTGRGYEAFLVTYDGAYEPWLLNHQPCISLDAFREIKKGRENVRCVTSLIGARAFLDECDHYYFWDMELAFTNNRHYSKLVRERHNIVKVAAISKTIQAWHMCHFQRPCVLLPNLLDRIVWKPAPGTSRQGRIGFMDEGEHVDDCIREISRRLREEQLEAAFVRISGNEGEVLSQMQTCEIFLGLNRYKDPLWGEGCPRTVLEALSAGCVVVAYDVIGNRETLLSGFNGVLCNCDDISGMAELIMELHRNRSRLERMAKNGQELIEACHTFEHRWEAVREFLGI